MPRGNGGPRGVAGLTIPRNNVGPYDDFFNGQILNPKWVLSGSSPGPTVSGGAVSFSSLFQGRYITQNGLTIPSVFTIYARLSAISTQAAMIGIFMLDSSGNGVGCSQYNGPSATYSWTVRAYAYNATGQSTPNATADHWLKLRRNASNFYVSTATHDATKTFDKQPYGAEALALADASTISQIGFGQMFTGGPFTATLEEFRALAV